MTDRSAAYSGLSDTRGQVKAIQEQFLGIFLNKLFDPALDEEENSKRIFTAAWLSAYEDTVEEFLGLILLLVQICARQPARPTEILSTQWFNSQNLRNVFIYEGTILISICYYKSQNITQQQRYVHRFLPPQLGQMVANFLTFIIPIHYLALLWSFRTEEPDLTDDGLITEASKALFLTYLWARRNDRWQSSELSDLLRKETVKYGLPELSIQSWRQISISIANRLFRAHKTALDFDDDENHGDQLNDFENSNPWDQLAPHSSAVAGNRYGVRLDIEYAKSEQSLVEHVNACRAWQKWLKVDQHHQPSNTKIYASEVGFKRPRSESIVLTDPQPIKSIKRVAVQL
ncbi:hypothetical protein TWF481_002605 [Arthrobotrys musiformis]|uniref:Uncharacterized protein n=1 Tax=Arthrobotrys musiformis TaxID=47236 RepID=A0AAV9VQP4_9PEZI